jgi:hypothetical protein
MPIMSEFEFDSLPPLDVLIDRIVDGGLSLADLRAAIRQLESTNDGWRGCTLAFLEAQCWEETLRDLGKCRNEEEHQSYLTQSGRTLSDSALLSRRSQRKPGSPWVRRGSMAAVAILAFTLGWVGHGLRGDAPGELPVVSSRAGSEGLGYEAAENEAFATPAEHSLPTIANQSCPSQIPLVEEIGRLHISSSADGTAEIPILDGPGVNPRSVLEQPAPISEHRRALWQRQGYELQQRRRIIAVPLADGRHAAVPVDQISVCYVGRDPL